MLEVALAAEKDKAEATKQEYEAKLDAVVVTENAKAELRTELTASTAKLALLCTELQVLREEMERLRLCAICHEQPRNAILMPCCHGQYCQRCATKVFMENGPCPSCRVKLTGFTQYFA